MATLKEMATEASPEEAFVRAFIVPEERRRLLWLLTQGEKKRAEFLDRLNHWVMLDPRFARPLKGPVSLAKGLEGLLRTKGAPDEVYVAADASPEIDGRWMPLREAIKALMATGFGGLISCVPGRLVYYQMEAPGQYLLERPEARSASIRSGR